MPIKYINKTYSAAVSTVVSGASQMIFGPIPADHLASMEMSLMNCQTTTLTFWYKHAHDYARTVEGYIPPDDLVNTATSVDNSGGVGAGVISTNRVKGVSDYNYITIHGSATGTISASNLVLRLTGKVVF